MNRYMSNEFGLIKGNKKLPYIPSYLINEQKPVMGIKSREIKFDNSLFGKMQAMFRSEFDVRISFVVNQKLVVVFNTPFKRNAMRYLMYARKFSVSFAMMEDGKKFIFTEGKLW